MTLRRLLALIVVVVSLVGCSTTTTPPDPTPTLAPSYLFSASPTPIRVIYGPDDDNIGELYLPHDTADSMPVVVLVHGGGWLNEPDMSYFRPLARAIAERGIAVWNIEYRRERADYRDTLADVGDAVDILATTVQEAAGGRLDLDRVHIAGHSAGGQLAAWAAGRHTLPASAPGAHPRVGLRSATIMAGVFDMARAANSEGDRFVPRFLGGFPDQVPDRYGVASPIGHLPIDVAVTAIHGDSDKTVSQTQSSNYVAAARAAGDRAQSIVLHGVGHNDFVDPDSLAWATTVDTIAAHARTTD